MKRRKEKIQQQWKYGREKKDTVNSENEVYITQTAWCCKSRGLKTLPTVSPQTRSHTLGLRGVNSWQNPPPGLEQRVYFMAEDTICWNKLKSWSVAVSYSTMKAWSKYLLSWIQFRSAVSWRWWDFWRVFLCVPVILRKKKKRAEQNTLAGKSTGFHPWRGPLLLCLKVSTLREN